MKKILGMIVLLLVGTAAFLVWSTMRHGSDRLNVLFVTIDTFRSDHCSAYGYPLRTTPRIDEIASQGVRFNLCYAPSASTLPSHTAIFTSLYPSSHGVLKNGFVVSQQANTMTESFVSHGYVTGAVVSSFVLDPRFGLNQGFAYYDADFSGGKSSINWKTFHGERVKTGFDRRANDTTDHAISWLSRYADGKKPFFLWVHYFDPHGPYDPPEPYRTKFKVNEANLDNNTRAIRGYDGEINFADNELGRLVDYLDEHFSRENTLLVITADHGEGLMQHGRMGHGRHIYEEDVRVPLILRLKGRLPAGLTLAGPVELVDLMPTFLDLAGISRANLPCAGLSLSSVLERKSQSDPTRKIYLQRRRYDDSPGDKFGIRYGNYKYIEAVEQNTRELYDLENDPHEMTNLAEQNPQQVQSLSTYLQTWQKAHPLLFNMNQSVSPEDDERLRALGYVQ